MTSQDLIGMLPHRPPMLLVDRVLEVVPAEHVVAEHDVSEDAFWCSGHFPGNPVMPGVLIAEALAQTAALVHLAAHPDAGGTTVLLAGMDKVRFRKPVVPGDTLRLDVRALSCRRGIYQFEAVATVEGHRVANGTFLAAVARD